MSDKRVAMSSYKAQIQQYGVPISPELYKELRSYANENRIKLTGFKEFVGDIEVIKTVIDDIVIISKDFPMIIDDKHGIGLELDYDMGTDYATTVSGHIIHLNAVFFSNLIMLEDDYQEGVREGRFVRNTNWRAIIRHEVGHVVAALVHIDAMEYAMDILETKLRTKVLCMVRDILSIYSAEYNDGREIVSECFSAYYSNVDIDFANKFVKKCIEKGGERNEVME